MLIIVAIYRPIYSLVINSERVLFKDTYSGRGLLALLGNFLHLHGLLMLIIVLVVVFKLDMRCRYGRLLLEFLTLVNVKSVAQKSTPTLIFILLNCISLMLLLKLILTD